MKIGDLVKHILLKNTRQVGVITETCHWVHSLEAKYKVLWACTQTEEYWFSTKEVEALCK